MPLPARVPVRAALRTVRPRRLLGARRLGSALAVAVLASTGLLGSAQAAGRAASTPGSTPYPVGVVDLYEPSGLAPPGPSDARRATRRSTSTTSPGRSTSRCGPGSAASRRATLRPVRARTTSGTRDGDARASGRGATRRATTSGRPAGSACAACTPPTARSSCARARRPPVPTTSSCSGRSTTRGRPSSTSTRPGTSPIASTWTDHYRSPTTKVQEQRRRSTSREWHTWGVVWTPTSVTFVVDGHAWGPRSPRRRRSPTSPMTLDLQQQTWCGILPECPRHRSQLLVDWVAVYTPTPSPPRARRPAPGRALRSRRGRPREPRSAASSPTRPTQMVDTRRDLHRAPRARLRGAPDDRRSSRDRLDALGLEARPVPDADRRGLRAGRRAPRRDGACCARTSTRSRSRSPRATTWPPWSTAACTRAATTRTPRPCWASPRCSPRRRDELAGPLRVRLPARRGVPRRRAGGWSTAACSTGSTRAAVIGCHVTSMAPGRPRGAARRGAHVRGALVHRPRASGAGGHGATAGTVGNVLLAVARLAGELGAVVDGHDPRRDGVRVQRGDAARRAPRRTSCRRPASLRGTLRTFTADAAPRPRSTSCARGCACDRGGLRLRRSSSSSATTPPPS